MSTIYSTEPPTKGKVVLHTSFGDLDVELWPKEAPKAVRNFVQLCLEGYYDGTSFHRLIKNYILQGGDASATGTGGESVYDKPFKDEFHSRLRFTHRGLLACAGETSGDAIVPDSNRSQFFITLDQTQQLDRKHTIFGKITGDTIFNLTDLDELEVGDNDEPVTKLVIRDAEVLWNPFDDLQPRVDKEDKKAALAEEEARQKHLQQKAATAAKAAVKQQGKRNAKLLSFDEEEEAEQNPLAQVKIRSYHDAVQDPRFLRDDAVEATAVRQAEAEAEEERKRKAAAVRGSLKRPAEVPTAGPSSASATADEEEQEDRDFAADMRAKAQAKRKAMAPEAAQAPKRQKSADVESGDDEKEDDDDQPKKGSRAEAIANSKAERVALMTSKRVKVADAELLTDWQRKNKEYKQRHALTAHRETDTLARLQKFKKALEQKQAATVAAATAPVAVVRADAQMLAEPSGDEEAYAGKVRTDIDHNSYKPAAWRVDSYLDASDDEQDVIGSLRSHKLVFSKDTARHDHMARQEKLDDYSVVDPLAEAKSKKPYKKTLRSELTGGPLL